MNEILPKLPKISLEMAKISTGNGSGDPGNVPWGPGNITGILINTNYHSGQPNTQL